MNIYQHFRPEEKDFIDQVLNWRDFVETTYSPKLTDFLDPREQYILKTVIGLHSEIKCEFFGGSPSSERKRAYIMPDYADVTNHDFEISLFEIIYPSKFVKIEHPHVLGSLMSLGLRRGKFGDIIFQNSRIQFFVCQDISDYTKGQVTSIGKVKVELVSTSLEEGICANEVWIEDDITVSSLRLDTVLSGIHHLSRQKSQNYIQGGHVKVNWTIVENPSFECNESDLISVRNFGRVKILSIEGKTKKEKWRMKVGKQK